MTFEHQDTGVRAFLRSLGADEAQTGSKLVDFVVSYVGWLLLVFIVGFYLLFSSKLALVSHVWFRIWIGAYLIYIIILEAISRSKPELYETPHFRVARTQAMIFLGSLLIYISGGETSPFWFIYLWPLFAVSLYFKQENVVYAYIEVSLLYLFVALIQPGGVAGLNPVLLLVNLAVMLVLSFVFFYLVQTLNQYRVAEKKIRHFELFGEIRREIDSAVDLQGVLDLILQKAVDLVNVNDGSLMLLNNNNALEFRARKGKSLPDGTVSQVFEKGKGIAGIVLKTGQPYVCHDTRTDSNFQEAVSGMQIRSLISVPIISQSGAVLGIINVDSSKPHRFSYTDVDLLLTLAMQVAQVVERAELWESLSQISAEALSDNAEGLYEHIVDVVHKLTHYPVLMWLVDESQESQAMIKAYRDVRHEYVQKRGRALKYSITGKVVDEGKEISVPDISSNENVSEETREEAALQGWKSLIAMPLLPEAGKAVGALTVFRTVGGQFTPWEVNLLETFVSQAGVAVRNARHLQQVQELLTQEREMRNRAETMEEVSRSISAGLELKEVAKSILVQLRKVVEYRTASMQLLQDDSRTLLAGEGFEEVGLTETLLRPVSEDRLIRRVVEGKAPVILGDVSQDADWDVIESTSEVKSWVGIPLVYGERPIGLLTLDHDQVGFYTNRLEGILSLFAQQAAIAIQKAQLLNQVGKRNQALEQLLEVGRDISNLAIQEPKATLERLARNLREALSADCVVIYPYDLNRMASGYFYDIDNTASFGLYHPLSLTDKSHESGMARRVREAEGQVLEISDINNASAELRRPFIKREGIEAFLGMALSHDNGQLGVLYVNFRSPHEFTDRERGVVKSITSEIVRTLRIWHDGRQTPGMRTQLPSLLQRVVDNARRLLDADIVTLYQYRRGRDVEFITPPVVSGELRSDPTIMARQIFPTDVPMLLVEKGSSYYASNIEEVPFLLQGLAESHDDLPERSRFAVREGLKSSAGILLKSEDEIVGVMFINYRSPTTFTTELQQEIDLFANQAAIAIRSARVFEQTQALVDVSHAISGAPDLPQLLDLILEEALNLVGFSKGWISLIDTESNMLEMRASRGLPSNKRQSLAVGEGITGHVAQTGQLLNVPDVAQVFQESINYETFFSDTRSELCVPLKYGEQILGILNLESPRLAAFSSRDEELMAALADVAATALHSMRRRLQDIAALQEITEAIGAKTLVGVFEMVSDKAMELTQATYSTLWLLDEAQHLLHKGAVAGREARSLTLAVDDSSINGHVALTRKPYRSGDVRFDPHYTSWYEDIQSNLSVPLMSGGRLLGTLHVESIKADAFTGYQCDLLQALGNQAAIAIEKAKSFAALQTINDAVTEKNLPEVLRLIVQQAVEVMPGEYGELWLFNPETGDLALESAVGPAAQKAYEIGRIAAGEGSTNIRVALSRQYEINEDLKPGNTTGFLRIYDAAQSSLTVPLKYHDEVVGTLNVESAQSKAFTEAHANYLDSLADQAAIAIVTARLVEQQLEDISLLQEVNAAITTANSEEIWNLIAEKAAKRARAEYCALWTVEGDKLIFRAVGGNLPAERRNIPNLPIDESSMNGYVAKRGETYVCDDVNDDPYYFAWLDNIQSSIAIPLKTGQRVIGTLGIESTSPQAFSEHLIKMLESLADQAAIAIESAKLWETLVKALHEISESIAPPLDVDKVLEGILEWAVTLLGEEISGDVQLLDETSEKLEIKAIRGEIVEKDFPEIAVGQGITGWVAEHKKPLLITDVLEDKRYIDYLSNIRCEIAAPMVTKEGRVLGVLNLEHPDVGGFDEKDLFLVQILANLAARAIENANLYQQIQQQRREQTAAMAELAASIGVTSPNQKEILEGILASTLSLMREASLGEVRLLEGENLITIASRGAVIAKEHRCIPKTQGITGWVAREGKPQLVGDVTQDERYLPYLTGTRSELTVPLKLGDKVIGVLNIEHPQVNAFTEDDLKLAEAMAALATVAIKLDRKVRNLQALHEIGRRLTSDMQLSKEEIITLIDEHASDLMNTESMYIALYDAVQRIVHFPRMRVNGEEHEVSSRSFGQGRTEWIIANKEPILIATKQESVAWYEKPGRDEYIGEPFASWIGVPMLAGEEVLGIIAAYHEEIEHLYDEDDLQVLSLMASYAAVALKNSQQLELLRGLSESLSAEIFGESV